MMRRVLPPRGTRGITRAARRVAIAILAIAGLLSTSVACTGAADAPETIALLLPEARTARYETFDRPLFEARVASLGAYRVLYSNADQDAVKQQQQAESALAAGAGVLVLDPVDARAAVSIVHAANAAGIPVISYDRLIAGGDLAYYVSFDNERVGMLQAEGLVSALQADGRPDGGILMINGSPTDSNAELFRTGAHRVIDASGVRVLAEFDTPDWSPDKAQEWVSGQIAQFGDAIDGVCAANDALAGGVVAAFKASDLTALPLITGQDAELSALQRIISGDQAMTVYKAIRPQAETAADVAVALLRGEPITAPLRVGDTPATLLEPVAVTIDTIADTVIADGFWSVDDICTPAYATACAAAGLR